MTDYSLLAKIKPIAVFLTENTKENLDLALKKFKKKVDNSGILEEFKRRQFYLKPSAAKRLKARKK